MQDWERHHWAEYERAARERPSYGRSYWSGLDECRRASQAARHAEEDARQAAGGTALLGEGTADQVWCAVMALRQGAILHCAGLTVGRGRLIDWRTIRSGETVAEGPDCLLAIEACRRVGPLVLMDATRAWVEGGAR